MSGGLRGAGPGRAPRSARSGSDSGVVIVETALVVPLLLAIALASLGVGRLVVTELAVTDCARDAALAAARGTDPRRTATCRLPSAAIVVDRGGGQVQVAVSAVSAPLPVLGGLSVRHTARATAALEPGR